MTEILSLTLMFVTRGTRKLTCGATVDLVHNEFRMRTDEKLLSISLSHPF